MKRPVPLLVNLPEPVTCVQGYPEPDNTVPNRYLKIQINKRRVFGANPVWSDGTQHKGVMMTILAQGTVWKVTRSFVCTANCFYLYLVRISSRNKMKHTLIFLYGLALYLRMVERQWEGSFCGEPLALRHSSFWLISHTHRPGSSRSGPLEIRGLWYFSRLWWQKKRHSFIRWYMVLHPVIHGASPNFNSTFLISSQKFSSVEVKFLWHEGMLISLTRKQKGQYKYNVTLRRIGATILAVEKQ